MSILFDRTGRLRDNLANVGALQSAKRLQLVLRGRNVDIMKDDSHTPSTYTVDLEDAEVRKLAQRAISVLASNVQPREDRLEQRLNRLCDAFIAAEEIPRHDAMQRLRQDGVSLNDIIDHVIPATARVMGDRWFADEISFAHVSIGAARLQETVRSLASRDVTEQRMQNSGPTVLLVIPRSEHHTLGAFVAADQFRRLGVSVEIAVDQHPRQIAGLLRKRRFAMVGITAAGRRTLASTRELVDIIRSTVTRVTPIVVGGAVLDIGVDVLAVTGADYLARDAQTALEKCGLSVAKREPSSNGAADHVD